MSSNGVIIGSFVKKDKILSFLETLKTIFKIKLEKVYIYDVDSNKYEYLVTFKAFDKDKFIGKLPNSTVMHVKNGCLFSINALNKLIDKINKEGIPNNEVIINWDEYKDKLIIQTNGVLTVSNINKIEDKTIFFN